LVIVAPDRLGSPKKKWIYRIPEMLFRRQATYTWVHRLPNFLLLLLFVAVAKEPHPIEINKIEMSADRSAMGADKTIFL
jgi:hypothetical protein